MQRLIKRYLELPKPIMQLAAAQFMLFLINAVFMLIGNIYLRKLAYTDQQIASFISYRFLGVLVLAFPLGLYIKGKKLKPFFLMSAIVVPISALLVVQAITWHNPVLIQGSFFILGFGFMLLQVCSLPFIMRTTPRDLLSEAISLSFATWSFAFIVAGGMVALLSNLPPFAFAGIKFHWDEYHLIVLMILMSTPSFLFFMRLQEGPPRSESATVKSRLKSVFGDYDWYLIIKSVVPAIIIAVGAGLTIPFINLFFYSTFGIDSDQFGLIGGITSVVVFISALLVPVIRRRYGYSVAIIMVQGLAILFLVILSLTEIFAYLSWAVYVAIGCYIIRQPLMNMSGPSTNELTMNYVGPKNQELISALNSSIWSAAWFVSAKIFQFLRGIDLEYYKIFLITALLYAVGVALYGLIIREYQARPATAED